MEVSKTVKTLDIAEMLMLSNMLSNSLLLDIIAQLAAVSSLIRELWPVSSCNAVVIWRLRGPYLFVKVAGAMNQLGLAILNQ